MLSTVKQRLGRDDEQGFTLIELMVVVLIIAILLAIAIPTFLGAKNTANSRAAQADLRNALTAEQTYFTSSQAFGVAGSMGAIEPNLAWTTTTPAQGNNVAVSLSPDTNIVELQAYGKDGNCYSETQTNEPGATSPATAFEQSVGACTVPTLTNTFPAVGSSTAHATVGSWEPAW